MIGMSIFVIANIVWQTWIAAEPIDPDSHGQTDDSAASAITERRLAGYRVLFGLAALAPLAWGYMELSVHHSARRSSPSLPPFKKSDYTELVVESRASAKERQITLPEAGCFALMLAGNEGGRISRVEETIELRPPEIESRHRITYHLFPDECRMPIILPLVPYARGAYFDDVACSGGSAPVTLVPETVALPRVLAILMWLAKEGYREAGVHVKARERRKTERAIARIIMSAEPVRPHDRRFSRFRKRLESPLDDAEPPWYLLLVESMVAILVTDNYIFGERRPEPKDPVANGSAEAARAEDVEVFWRSVAPKLLVRAEKEPGDRGDKGGKTARSGWFDRGNRWTHFWERKVGPWLERRVGPWLERRRDWWDSLANVTRLDLDIHLRAAKQSRTVHYFVKGPPGTYLAEHRIVLREKAAVTREPGSDAVAPGKGAQFQRERLGQSYAHLYVRDLPTCSDDIYYVRFAESPPGARGRVGVVGVAQAVILGALSAAMVFEKLESLAQWVGVIIALPSIAGIMASVQSGRQRQNYSLVSRVLSACMVLVGIGAAVYAVLQEKGKGWWGVIGAVAVGLGALAAASWAVDMRVYHRLRARTAGSAGIRAGSPGPARLWSSRRD
jgi:hypothetical protein